MELYLRQAISCDGHSIFSHLSLGATTSSNQYLISRLKDNTRPSGHGIRTAFSRFRGRKSWNDSFKMAVGIYQITVGKCSWYLMSCPVPIGGCLLLLMIGKRRIWPSVRFWVLSSLSSWRCCPSETQIPSPIIGVNNVLAQSEHEMFFLACGRRHTASLPVWYYVRGSEVSPRILRDSLWRRLAALLLLWEWVEIEDDSLLLHHHLILSDLGKTPFLRRCTSCSAVTLHLFLVTLGTFQVAILLGVPCCEASR